MAFPNSRHSLFIANYEAAVGGDPAALQELMDFFLTGDGALAAFTPGDTYGRILSTAGLSMTLEGPVSIGAAH